MGKNGEFKKYDSDGNLKSVCKFEDDQYCDTMTIYYKNGSINETYDVKKDIKLIKHGQYKLYCLCDDMVENCSYFDGMKHGEQYVYKKGVLNNINNWIYNKKENVVDLLEF